MKCVRVSLLFTTMVFFLSCAEIRAQMISDKVVNDFLSIDSYRGVQVQKGLIPGERDNRLVSEVLYQKAWKIRSEVVEPASRKGELFIFDGKTLTLWWPKELFGVRIHGAVPPNMEQIRRIVREDHLWAQKSYAFSYLGQERMQKRLITKWKVFPTRDAPFFYPYESWVDKRYSIPIKVVIRNKPKRVWYSMEYKKIDFGVEVPEGAFSFEFPPNAVVFEWDLTDPGQSLDEMKNLMNFEMVMPKKLPREHKVKKIIKGKSCLPMAIVVMEKEGRWLSLTQMRSLSPSLESKTGIPIMVGKENGHLYFMGTVTMVNWTKGNTYLSLIGNLPYPDLISIAKKVGKPQM